MFLIHLPPDVSPLAFRLEPDWAEVARGFEAFDHHKTVLQGELQPLDFWFNGLLFKISDKVIFLSPKLISRKLGYQQAKLGWDRSELLRVWGNVRQRLNGKLTFAVVIQAFPTRSFLGSEYETEQITHLPEITGTYGAASFRRPLTLELVRETAAADAKSASLQWDKESPFCELWGALPDVAESGNSVGEYRSALYLASAPLPSRLSPSLEVRINSGERSKLARFEIYARRR